MTMFEQLVQRVAAAEAAHRRAAAAANVAREAAVAAWDDHRRADGELAKFVAGLIESAGSEAAAELGASYTISAGGVRPAAALG